MILSHIRSCWLTEMIQQLNVFLEFYTRLLKYYTVPLERVSVSYSSRDNMLENAGKIKLRSTNKKQNS